MNHYYVELTERELAFIFLMRRSNHGSVDSLSIVDGQPAVIKAGTQRIDLLKEGERTRLLTRGSGVVVDLSSGELPSCVEDLAST